MLIAKRVNPVQLAPNISTPVGDALKNLPSLSHGSRRRAQWPTVAKRFWHLCYLRFAFRSLVACATASMLDVPENVVLQPRKFCAILPENVSTSGRAPENTITPDL